MDIQERKLEITKTARFVESAYDPGKVEEVWFVCHGYGQLAPDFLKEFGAVESDQRRIIAPEGLHRFYLKGTGGRVGASWMTKEDRETDINDYVRYLDDLYDSVMREHIGQDVRIRVLGFSQGVATVCRWMAQARSRADELILWAGVFPPDLDLTVNKRIFQRMRVRILVGDSDEFRDEESLSKEVEKFREHDIPYEFQEFQGKHEIQETALKGLLEA